MTPGVDDSTLDAFSKRVIRLIIDQMRDRSFQFKPTGKEFLPKANGKIRPLGIPPLIDKVVQEAIGMLLEPVFEPRMVDESYGFRPGRSAHLALRTIRRKWTGTTWLIEGDLKGYFNNINHKILASLLMRRVKDQQIIDLYWKLVWAGFVNNGTREPYTLTRVPPGGILSPLLSNIYLHEFDVWMKNLAASFGAPGKLPGRDKYLRRLNQMANLRERAKVQRTTNRELKEQILWLEKRKRLRPSTVHVGTKIDYVRYADDWVIGVTGPKNLAVKIKDNVKEFLTKELKLELNKERSKITHLATERGRFLGTLISARNNKYAESLWLRNKPGHKV
uniref:Reverse transcriptase domain-containing protein n=1 Tax=Anthoceros agrestis TaxID=41834 RepID=A0A6B9PIE3_9EMBR|nr:hypothetical protein [Anthoceros agrestis]